MASDLSVLNESFRHHSSKISLSPTDSQHFPDSLFNFPSIFETVSNHPFQPQPAPTPPSNFFSTPDPPLSLTSVSVTREGIEDLDALKTIGVTTEYTDYSRPNGLPVPDDGYMQSHVNPDFFFQPHSSSLLGRSNLQTQMPNFSENLQFEEDFPVRIHLLLSLYPSLSLSLISLFHFNESSSFFPISEKQYHAGWLLLWTVTSSCFPHRQSSSIQSRTLQRRREEGENSHIPKQTQ